MKAEIGKRLKRLRLERGLTQKELAARVKGGLDYTYIGKIERCEQLPSLKILIKIGEALSVPVAYFFRDERVAIPRGILPSELKHLLEDERGRELVQALQLIHGEDIQLVTEIIRVLGRHRKGSKAAPYDAGDDASRMAAEEDTSYG